jgi:cardiolipin synthase
MAHDLIVLPDDSAKPIVDAINSATKSLRVKMFVFSDATLLAAVIAAKRRGVKVRIMLNPTRRSGKPENRHTVNILEATGVDVIDSNPAFEMTHEKSMVIDDVTAFVKSLNWKASNFTDTRDYAIVTSRSQEVDEIIECFEADWERKPFDRGEDAHLIWCTNNGRERIAQCIDDARKSIFVQNERYQDAVIIECLVRAALRGVKVHVMARPPHNLQKEKLTEAVGGLRIMDDVGIKVHRLKYLKLHAKMVLADRSHVIVGSINLTPGSFDSRRELAIEVHEGHVVKRMIEVVHHDWKHSHRLDLSDKGLLAEFERYNIEWAEKLGLKP